MVEIVAYILLSPKNDVDDRCCTSDSNRLAHGMGKIVPDSARSLSTIKDRV